MTEQAALHVRKATFKANKAVWGGAVYAEHSLVDIVRAEFDENVASKGGGGIYIHIPKTAVFTFGLLMRVNHSAFNGNRGRVGGEYTERGLTSHWHMHLCNDHKWTLRV